MGGAASTPVPAELKRDEALALVAQHFDTLAAGAETVARDKLAASLAALTCAPSGAGDTTGAGAADTSSGAKEDATRGAHEPAARSKPRPREAKASGCAKW